MNFARQTRSFCNDFAALGPSIERRCGTLNNRYIAFDVETPNYANDRISSIGITIVENGTVVDEFYSLVNPEVHFDPFNIQLTGITPQLVANQPTFSQLWGKILPIMGSGLLVAHNAPFDMGVLAQCLNEIGRASCRERV